MIEAIAAILGISGSVFITQPKMRILGFAVWIVGNIIWATIGVTNRDFWFTLQFVIYEFTAIVGFVIELRGILHADSPKTSLELKV